MTKLRAIVNLVGVAAFIALGLFLVGVTFGCEQYDRQKLTLDSFNRDSPFASSMGQYQRGPDGVSLLASLAADYVAEDIEFTSTASDGTTVMFKAAKLGVDRTDQLEAMEANINAMNGRVDSFGDALARLAAEAARLALPVPIP